MMRILIILLLISSSLHPVGKGCLKIESGRFPDGKPDPWEWVRQAGTSDWTYGNDVAVDDSGNAYVVGFMNGEADFSGQRFSVRGESDLFIAKYQPQGALSWAKQFGTAGYLNAQAVRWSAHNVLYITGSIRNGILQPGVGRARIGNTVLLPGGEEDMILAAFDSMGTPLWATQAGSTHKARGEDIALDGSGNLYVTGSFMGRFGETSLISPDKEAAFIAKYSSSGTLLWARGILEIGARTGKGIAVDQTGYSYVTGLLEAEDTTRIGGRSFLARYDADGVLTWVRTGDNSQASSMGYSVGIDNAGNSIVTGAFTGRLVLDSIELVSTPPRDIKALSDVFLAKYSPDGVLLWARSGGGPGGDHPNAVAVDADGNVYVTGSIYESAIFGGRQLAGKAEGTQNRSTFVVKYSPQGDVVQTTESDGPSLQTSSGNGISFNKRGDCYLTGFFDGTIAFGSTRLSGFNSRNMFIAKIDLVALP